MNMSMVVRKGFNTKAIPKPNIFEESVLPDEVVVFELVHWFTS